MHPGLTLINLKFFHDTAQRLSVSEAAKHNFVTQSAISQAILKLEKALQCDLTNHNKYRLKLTAEGEIAFKEIQKIFRSLKELQDKLLEQHQQISGSLHLAITPSIAIHLLPRVIQKMQKNYPDVSITMRIGHPEQIRNDLKTGLVDLGLVLEHENFISFEQKPLHSGTFCIYSKGGKLHDGLFVDSRKNSFVKSLQKIYAKKYKQELPILAELDSWEVVARFVDNGLGSGFIPDYLLSQYPNLTAIQNKELSVPYTIVAVYNPGDILSRAARSFLEIWSASHIKT